MNTTAMIATINGSSKLLFMKRRELTSYALSADLLCGASGHRRQFTSRAMGGLARSEEATQSEIYPPVNRLGI
jgi:hypothetical protein